MPSDLQVDNIKDGSATKTLATLSSSAVTLHSDVTFATGSIQQIQSVTHSGQVNVSTGTPTEVTNFNKGITVKKTGSKILMILTLTSSGTRNNDASNRLEVKITESVTSLDYWVVDVDDWSNTATNKFNTKTYSYFHTHGQNAGTALTYKPKFSIGQSVTNGGVFNYFYSSSNGGDNRESNMILMEIV